MPAHAERLTGWAGVSRADGARKPHPPTRRNRRSGYDIYQPPVAVRPDEAGPSSLHPACFRLARDGSARCMRFARALLRSVSGTYRLEPEHPLPAAAFEEGLRSPPLDGGERPSGAWTLPDRRRGVQHRRHPRRRGAMWSGTNAIPCLTCRLRSPGHRRPASRTMRCSSSKSRPRARRAARIRPPGGKLGRRAGRLSAIRRRPGRSTCGLQPRHILHSE